ncbi:MAG: CopD family protein, partial [Alphaproteobacteria bacterium]|nr:CopD family protein [Alphaproteobacteria bacterium]
ERRLLKAIMHPAAIASWAFGLAMVAALGDIRAMGWLHAKLSFVVLLTVSHLMMMRWKADFALDRNQRPTRFFRMINEVPTLLMIGIVVLVIVKPF